MKILAVLMKYDYGVKERGYSYEYYNIFLPLCDELDSQNVILYDFYSDYKNKGVEVVGIVMESGEAEEIRQFMRAHRIKYTVALGNNKVVEEFGGVTGLPTTFIIDKQGKIVRKYEGFAPSIIDDIEIVLKENLGNS